MKLLTLFFIFLFSAGTSFGASILQIKNGRILISLDGASAKVGQVITLLDTDGKQVATATLNQVKNGKAIATIKTGKADGSETVQLPKAEGADSEEPVMAEDSFTKQSKGIYRLNSARISMLLGIGLNSMVTKLTDSTNIEDVSLKGTSIALSGALDYPLLDWLIFRGTLGYEPFNAAGTAVYLSCDGRTSRDCNAMINYLAAGGFARINFTKSKLQFWGGLGAVAKFPISKSTTALSVDDVKLTTTFGAAFGADYFLSNKTFIPVSVDYQMFLPSDTVSGNMITIRGGYGWAF